MPKMPLDVEIWKAFIRSRNLISFHAFCCLHLAATQFTRFQRNLFAVCVCFMMYHSFILSRCFMLCLWRCLSCIESYNSLFGVPWCILSYELFDIFCSFCIFRSFPHFYWVLLNFVCTFWVFWDLNSNYNISISSQCSLKYFSSNNITIFSFKVSMSLFAEVGSVLFFKKTLE